MIGNGKMCVYQACNKHDVFVYAVCSNASIGFLDWQWTTTLHTILLIEN